MIATVPRLSQPGWAVEAERLLGTTLEQEREFKAKAKALRRCEKATELLDDDEEAIREVFSAALSGTFDLVEFGATEKSLEAELADSRAYVATVIESRRWIVNKVQEAIDTALTEKAPPKARLEKLIASLRKTLDATR